MFGRKKLQAEITELRDRIRDIETYTVRDAAESKRELYKMNRTDYGYSPVLTRLTTLEANVHGLQQQPRLATHEELNKVWHLVNNLAELLGFKRNVHTGASVCPDMWVESSTDESQSMKTVLEPNGRLRQAHRKGD